MSVLQTEIPQASRIINPESRTDASVGLKDSGGGKKLKKKDRKKNCKTTTIQIATYNARSLSTAERQEELEKELEKIKWDIVGLSEVRNRGEELTELPSGHMMYARANHQQNIGGVGFLINKNIKNQITEYDSVSERLAYVQMKISKRYRIKIVQIYAPTTDHNDEEVEGLYDEIAKCLRQGNCNFRLLIGDFDAKLGIK